MPSSANEATIYTTTRAASRFEWDSVRQLNVDEPDFETGRTLFLDKFDTFLQWLHEAETKPVFAANRGVEILVKPIINGNMSKGP